MKNIFRHSGLILGLIFSVFSATSAATSGTIGKYNLILLGDYNFTGGDVEGQTLIGGNLNATGQVAEFGSRLPNTDTAIDAVTIIGDVNANGVRVKQDNNLVYGGTLNVSNVELNDGDQGQLIQRSGMSIAAVENQLQAESTYFKNLSDTGAVVSGSDLAYQGTGTEAVFNVTADSLFATPTNGLTLDWGTADTVIINVGGENIDIDGGVNLIDGFTNQSGFSNIVWNFYEATSIDFNNMAVKGSVLAPYAHTTGGSSFDGAFAAISYTGAREFHNFVFNYTSTSTEVPEPPAIALMVACLAFVLRSRKAK